MYRDTMPQISNMGWKELNRLMARLGIDEKDVNNILTNILGTKELVYLSMGPQPYYSSYYGTVSIHDF